MNRKVKIFWLKITVSILIPVTALTLHLTFPNFYSNIGSEISSWFKIDEMGSDIFIQKIIKARNNKPKFTPVMSTEYKGSYSDNILYTQEFISTVTTKDFQKKWIISLQDFFVNQLKLSENTTANFIPKEMRLIYELFDIRNKIKPRNATKGMVKMKNLEAEYVEVLTKILGNRKENYQKFVYFRKSFYENFKNNTL